MNILGVPLASLSERRWIKRGSVRASAGGQGRSRLAGRRLEPSEVETERQKRGLRHVLCVDGVYVDDSADGNGELRFVPAPAPAREELEETRQFIYARTMTWLSRKGLLRSDETSNETPTYSPGEALTLLGCNEAPSRRPRTTARPATTTSSRRVAPRV